jgi:hypothetical protein
MRRQIVAAAVLVVALALPATAAAKGPASASISGPDVRSLAIQGQGEGQPGTPLGMLVDAGGYFSQMFGENPDPTVKARPKGILGPRYKVVYVVPGPNGIESKVVQFLYPFAKPVPLTYMKPGQRFWNTERAHGGWYRSSTALTRMLITKGLPRR